MGKSRFRPHELVYRGWSSTATHCAKKVRKVQDFPEVVWNWVVAMAMIWLGAHCAQLRERRETFGCAYLQA
jgi:hypothetical protein